MGIMARPGKYKYRIYLNETNELIASGLRKECIKQLNMDPVQFDNLVNNVTRGRSRKYRIDREDNDAHDIYMPINYYTVYLNKTEEIIASGTAEECARQLNTTTGVFYCIKSRAMSGKIKKYSVVTERYEYEEDDNDI